MKIATFDKVPFNGTEIWTRRLGDTSFEWLFARGNSIYTDLVEVAPREEQRQQALLGKGDFYSDKEIIDIRKVLIDRAQSVIRLMEAKEFKEKQATAKREHRNFVRKKIAGK